jgi:F0F1-type ATP synthase assembly protein I
MQFGISIILFTLLGNWLDGKFNTSPGLLLAGMVIGATGGFYGMYRKLTAREREARERANHDRPTAGDQKRGKGGTGSDA